MGKKDEKPVEQAPVVDRELAKEIFKLRASGLKWDPDHLREFLCDLVDML